MEKREFGILIREARAEKNLSLRRLARLSGVDYSRLARIEQGSRPAPDLSSIRTLAGVLDLDLAELLVAAGTSRSVVEELVWAEQIRLGHEGRALGAYRPGRSRLAMRNTFEGRVEQRCGALCDVRVGNVVVRVVSFSDAGCLRLTIPPETVWVTKSAPRGLSASAATVVPARVVKVRSVGQLLDIVLAADGLELNALVASDRDEPRPVVGERLVAAIMTAAVQTTPLEEEACAGSLSDS